MSLKHDSPRKLRKNKSKWKVSTPEEYEERELAFIKEQLIHEEPTIKGQVRISGGKVKNYMIDIPRKTRPVTDRMKTRIFDILREDIAKKTVLDLYAGSGSFGLEALSRGAKSVTFVDASKQAEGILINNVKKTGYLTETEIIRIKAFEFVVKSADEDKEFEIIFIDPPYKIFNRKHTIKVEQLLNETKRLLPGYNDYKTKKFRGVIILKHPRRYPIETLDLPGLSLLETLEFGVNCITLFIVSPPKK